MDFKTYDALRRSVSDQTQQEASRVCIETYLQELKNGLKKKAAWEKALEADIKVLQQGSK